MASGALRNQPVLARLENKLNHKHIAALALLLAGCGSAGDSVLGPAATTPEIQPVPAETVTEQTAVTVPAPQETAAPASTSGSEATSSLPAYLSAEDVQKLLLLDQKRPEFASSVRLPSGAPLGFSELVTTVFAGATETGDFVTISWSLDREKPPAGWEAFLDVSLVFTATPTTDTLSTFYETLQPSGLTVGGAPALLGPDVPSCGTAPESTLRPAGEAVEPSYIDQTVLAWEASGISYAFQASPVPRCSPAPYTIEELARFLDDAVVCNFAALDASKACESVAR